MGGEGMGWEKGRVRWLLLQCCGALWWGQSALRGAARVERGPMCRQKHASRLQGHHDVHMCIALQVLLCGMLRRSGIGLDGLGSVQAAAGASEQIHYGGHDGAIGRGIRTRGSARAQGQTLRRRRVRFLHFYGVILSQLCES